MAELRAGGDSHRGGDGAVQSETGDCAAGAGGGPAGAGRRAGLVGPRVVPGVPRPRLRGRGPERPAAYAAHPGLERRSFALRRRLSAAGA